VDQWNVLLVFAGTPATPTGNITAQKLTLPAMRVQLQLGAYDPVNERYLVTITGTFHNRLVGDWINISGAVGSSLPENYKCTDKVVGVGTCF
jgi:hypothetical protein